LEYLELKSLPDFQLNNYLKNCTQSSVNGSLDFTSKEMLAQIENQNSHLQKEIEYLRE
jgi:molybdenum cofactor biosynthesis enzyme MoaA